MFELVGAAVAALAANLLSTVVAISPSLVTLASLIVLLPGMSLTVAMTQTLQGFYLSSADTSAQLTHIAETVLR